MKYIRPKSLTWWAGLFTFLVGVAALVMPDSYQVTQIGALLSMLAGGADASPAGLMGIGLGLIGLRSAIETSMRSAPDA